MRRFQIIKILLLLILVLVLLLFLLELRKIHYSKNIFNISRLNNLIELYCFDSLSLPTNFQQLEKYIRSRGEEDLIDFYSEKLPINLLLDTNKSLVIVYINGFLNIDNKLKKKVLFEKPNIKNYFLPINDLILSKLYYKKMFFNKIIDSALYKNITNSVNVFNNKQVYLGIDSCLHKYFNEKYVSDTCKDYMLDYDAGFRKVLLYGRNIENQLSFTVYHHNLKDISASDTILAEVIQYLETNISPDSIEEIYFPIRLIEKDQVICFH